MMSKPSSIAEGASGTIRLPHYHDMISTSLRAKLEDAACIAGRHCRRRDFWRASSPSLPDLIGFLRLGWGARFRRPQQHMTQLSTFRATLAEAGLRRTAIIRLE